MKKEEEGIYITHNEIFFTQTEKKSTEAYLTVFFQKDQEKKSRPLPFFLAVFC